MASLRAVSIAIALIVATGCADKSAGSAAATDSSLARDLALAGSQTAEPMFQDTAVAPAPAPAQAGGARSNTPPATERARVAQPPVLARPQATNRTPATTPAPIAAADAPAASPAPGPAAVHGEIGAGTGFALTSGAKVCTNSNLPGDKIVATVNSAVTGSNGAVIPAGSTVVLEVATATPGQNADAAQITFRVRAIVIGDKTVAVEGANVVPEATLVKSKVENVNPNADRNKVLGGAIAGAVLGQMIGHNTKGTIIGAATGAAAGAVAAKAGEKWQACLPAGAPLHVTLNAPIVLS